MPDALALYDFELPSERIAQRPAARRDESRLMLLRGDESPSHHRFRDLPDLLRPDDLLIRNDTRVLPARLRGRRPGGGKAELLLVHRLDPDGGERWLCLARPAAHLKQGMSVSFGAGELSAVVQEKRAAGQVLVRFDGIEHEVLLARLEQLGEVPLPPYIARAAGPDAIDRERYQTTYAARTGAVAAPTAGLHFTPEVDADLAARGIEMHTLTLHVGPGTFRPIKTETLDEHVMDAEFYDVSEATAAAVTSARRSGRRIIAVGTTTARTLESVTDDAGTTHAGSGWTDIFLRPGHVWRGIDGLLTNFHLPRSSLLVLVSALAGRERMLDAYREAVRLEYNFYSYGDAMLILPERR